MKRWWQQWLLVIPGVFLAEWIVDGIEARNWPLLLLVAAVLGALNIVLKPLLVFFALPFVIFTLGLGIVFINALLVLLAGGVVPGFEVTGFWAAFWGGLVISIASMIASALFGEPKKVLVRTRRRKVTPPAGGKPSRDDVIDV